MGLCLVSRASETLHEKTDLGGRAWSLGAAPAQPFPISRDRITDDRSEVEEWLPACVPGNVQSDLITLGKRPDPYFADNLKEWDGFEGQDWWYHRSVQSVLTEKQRAFLIFRGIDYYSAVFADTQCVGRHEGMFASQEFEVTRQLQETGELDLAVRLWGASRLPRLNLSPGQRALQALARLARLGEIPFPDRLASLKSPMSYGWDFAPPIFPIGIWDNVELKVSGPAAIMHLWPRAKWPAQPTFPPKEIPLLVDLEIDSAQECAAELDLCIAGLNHDHTLPAQRFQLRLSPGRHIYRFQLPIKGPLLWYPWDRGDPHLYQLGAGLHNAGRSECWDAESTTFGIRHIRVPRGDNARQKDHCQWEINGRHEFVRGLNWVPADALPGRLRAQDYTELVSMAKDTQANLLRVWGGGLREKKAFYSACDQAGLLVWQEFPFACVFLGRLPRHRDYLDLVGRECRAIIRSLRHHPSLSVWCGGNEISPSRNRPVFDLLEQICQEQDGSRPFLPASPHKGDVHNWDVWHGWAPASDYHKESGSFVSELGLQAPPAIASLQRFLPEPQLWPAGAGWETHHAQLEKMRRYASLFRKLDDGSVDGFIQSSQEAQARALQIAIEHLRRRKGECGGIIIWQMNEPWPAISWSLFDYYRQPKTAGRRLHEWFSPLLMSLEYPFRDYRRESRLEGRLWIINDGDGAFQRCTAAISQEGSRLWSRVIDVSPNCSYPIAEVILESVHCDALLHLELLHNGEPLSVNDYDLGYYDPQPMAPLRCLRRRLAGWLLH